MTDVAAGPDPARPDEPSAGPSRADEPRTDPARPDEPSAGPPCVDAPRTDPSGPDERWSDLTPPPGSPRHARPVRWLAATLTLGVLALLAVALTGAVAPQVRPAVSSGPAWAGGGRVEVEVRNEAVTGTLDGTRPWTSDTLVMTYSCAKPLAALAVLTAVRDGALGKAVAIAKGASERDLVIVEGVWPGQHFVNRLGVNALTSAEPGYPNGGAVFHDTAVWLRKA